ncbi:hypothetical protein DV532_25650 (plasmid) [Pseudomonas sp. Leaf58]|uniref:hypothetical protein n=1 Tax=Pseudomonas TaxID=286 RepID=UPI0006FF36B3|nr:MULTISPECIES: hypothetical protein [Pseudomonas]AYG47683.1 hypothetical protein DV532_25650 [Pseudomonas sp. Leaf58]KQN62755.1 hypothetical protein ASF02_11460 [Pseudomonas sp. Leaf58]MDT8924999.1 hypothetical protein [Pseudomonas taiwanensis]
MKIIPLKEKHKLSETDISNLSQWMISGKSLEEMAYSFNDRISVPQIFIAAGILAKEMYDTTLAELCPHLVEERRALSESKHGQWQEKKTENRVLDMLRKLVEDLTLYEYEMIIRPA